MHQSVIFSITFIFYSFFSSYAYAQQPYDSWFEKDNPYGFPIEFPEDTHKLIYEAEKNPFITLKTLQERLAKTNISLDEQLTLLWVAAWIGYNISDLSVLNENVSAGLLLADNQNNLWLYYQFLILKAEVYRQQGNDIQALLLIEEALSWARAKNDLYTVLHALTAKSEVLIGMGNSVLALSALQEAYTIAPDLSIDERLKAVFPTRKDVQFGTIHIHQKIGNYEKVYELTSDALNLYDSVDMEKNKVPVLLYKKSEAAFYLGRIDEALMLIEDAVASAQELDDPIRLFLSLSYKLRLELKTKNVAAAQITLRRIELMKYVPESIDFRFELDALRAEFFIVDKNTEQADEALRYIETQYDNRLLNYEQIKHLYQLYIRVSLLNNNPSNALEYSNLKVQLIEKQYQNNIENSVKQVSLLAEQQESERQKRVAENELLVSTNKTLVMEKVQFWLIVGIFLLVLLLGLLSFLYRKNKDLMQKIKLLAVTDSLTGLNNRMQGLALMKQQSEVTKRNGEAFCLALIDLDKFKILNDTHGHQMGDKALQLFANTAKEQCRTADVICRYGGEEFIIAFPNTDENTAHNVLCRLQDKLKIASHQLGIKNYEVTFSVGLVNSAKCPDLTSAIELADQAMYAAKKQGRDRIILSTHANNVSANTNVLFSS